MTRVAPPGSVSEALDEGFADVGEQRLCYVTFGDADALMVLFIHGALDSFSV